MRPYDALLVVSFGGPEAPEEVMPFLEHVTAGRGIPRERLAEVAEHYHHFGGVSPINGLNRALVADIAADFAAHGLSIPVYWANRHSAPMLVDVIAQMRDDGVRHAAAFLTSAYASFSSCRQYLDAIERARVEVGDAAPVIDRLRQYFDHPGFVDPMVDGVHEALAKLPAEVRDDAHLVFVAHSIPTAMDVASGPVGGMYTRQLAAATRLVADAVGGDHPVSQAFCSRSGPPSVPWLVPDVSDHLDELATAGARGVVVVPIGFVSDHMEVVYDLDTEAAHHAAGLGLAFVRSATAAPDPRFVAMVRELLTERMHADVSDAVERRASSEFGPAHDVCPGGCCRLDTDERIRLRELAVHAARVTGDFLLQGRARDLVVATKSTPTDVVTQMDTEAERLIASIVKAGRPDDAMLGEEGQAEGTRGARVRWIVDPIDGTVNYLYALPQWAVSIAVEIDGVVEVGVVFDPSKGEMFTAIRGDGAQLNRRPIVVSSCTQLSQALVATGFGYDAARRAAQARVLTKVLPTVRDIRRLGAASLDLCALACGRVDAYYERGLNLWDHAAAGLIAAEAGAVVGGVRGTPPSGELLIAAVPSIFPAVHELLAGLDADRD